MDPEQISNKRRLLVYGAAVLSVVFFFIVLIWRLEHPAVPSWAEWAAGGIGFTIPLFFMPRVKDGPSIHTQAFKIVCHLLCLPLGFVPLLLAVWIGGLLGSNPNQWPGGVFKVGAGLSIALSISLSFWVEARFFNKKHRHPAPRP